MKKHIHSFAVIMICVMALGFISCNKENEKPLPPTIALDVQDAIYSVKVGKTLTIEPNYTNAENAVFAWKLDGTIISTSPVLEYTPLTLGDRYLSLSVINDAGEAYIELMIQVVNLLPPVISLALPEEGYTILKSGELALTPSVSNTDEATYKWLVNGVQKATTKDFTFTSETTGIFNLEMIASNPDGEDRLTFNVNVCLPEDLPFKWGIESSEYNVAQGRDIRIKIWDIENDFDGEYTWTLDGDEVQKGRETIYIFKTSSSTTVGEHTLICTMKNPYTTVSQTFKVNVCPPEGTYKRTASAASSSSYDKVYEFTAAPGQFINENYIATTAQQAADYAHSRMQADAHVSLGGWGGYLVVGFDHSIENDGSYNIQILGNSFEGSSEPGVVYVMQDENGDGLPNDTWYELKGSVYGTPEEIRDYAVTYYRPKSPGMPVQWIDNMGGNGSVDYLASYHRQEYYYPAWIAEDSYTLRGTLLPPVASETSPGYWFNSDLGWGYADNFSPIDRLTDDDNYNANVNANHFKISDAVTHDGRPANLKYIDFVKVMTGTNCKAGWLGENSTEVFGFNDFNMIKNK